MCVEPSPFAEGAAYLVVDNHRMDDYHPYVWKTADFGKTWTKIVDGLAADVPARVVREDPKRKGLLYLGTERGVTVLDDGGKTWLPLRLNMPTVAVSDLVVKDDDLVVGTSGRSVWILDDLTPIREWTSAVEKKAGHAFPVKPAVRWRQHALVSHHGTAGAGENPKVGAAVFYYLKEKPKKPPTVEVKDAAGKRVVFYDGKDGKPDPEDDDTDEKDVEAKHPEVPAEPGVNRFVWDLCHAGADFIPKAKIDSGDPTAGFFVAPGTYTVVVTADGKPLTTKVEVALDPRVRVPRGGSAAKGAEVLVPAPRVADSATAERLADAKWVTRWSADALLREEAVDQEAFALGLRDDITRLTGLVKRVRSVAKQLRSQSELLADEPRAKMVAQQGAGLAAKLDGLEAELHNPKAEVSYDILAQRGGAKLYSQLAFLLATAAEADGPPTQGLRKQAVELREELARLGRVADALFGDELKTRNDAARKLGLPTVYVPPAKP